MLTPLLLLACSSPDLGPTPPAPSSAPPAPTAPCGDQDSDGVCDSDDHCPGSDDSLDADLDGTPDGCDPCPLDPADDSDSDGTCDSDDQCPGSDDSLDTDLDGTPDGCDPCPLDPADDSDSDGTCDSDDQCPGFDDTIDTDADGEVDGCELRIAELCSENDTTLILPGGLTPDWIELHNPGAEPLSLQGYSIIDSLNRLAIPLNPQLEVPAGGRLLLYASGDETLGVDHLPFRLDNDGDDLYLYLDGELVDAIDFGELLDDVSLARVAFDDWIVTDLPTPGSANPLGSASLDPIVQPCDPVLEGTRYITEGERLQVEASCSLPGAFDLQLFGTLSGLSGTTVDWQTTNADAGSTDLLIVAKPAGHRGVPETERREVSVADAWSDASNVSVDPTTYKKEWGLPVLHLETTATLLQTYTDITGTLDGVAYSGQMKIRGATSVTFPKNGYTLEFDPVQIPLGDYGLQNKDHLVLVSTFDDNSYIRQRFMYETWREMAVYSGVPRLTPRTMDLVVYIDGEYHGFYTAIDHIDDEFIREMGFDDSGDLYKAVHHHANYRLTDFFGVPKTDLSMGWEKKEGPWGDYTTIQDLTAFTGSSSSSDFAADHSLWLDLDDAIDWYWLVRHTAADDTVGKNAYAYYDPTSARFRFVPWDFNESLGQTWATERVDVNGLSTFYDKNKLFAFTLDDPGLLAVSEARYATLREAGGPLSLAEMLARADRLISRLGPHGQRDFEKWEEAYRAFPRWASRTDWTTHEEEVAYVLQWIMERDAVMGAAHP